MPASKAPWRRPSECRILVAEDDPDLLGAICEILAAQELEVQGAPDGQTALDHLGRRSYDLVLSDLRMPDVSGLEVVRRARELVDRPALILMTADPAACDPSPADLLLRKPFSLRSLVIQVLATLVRREKERTCAP
jgi:DNA-binding response OmpR family regulator